ncbi:MAG: ATP-binding protein [Planctomycetota bacterium]|nr:MAG: ATP-binding protein [Planctomycetota bacterium]
MANRRRTLREFRSEVEGEGLEFKDPRVLAEPYNIAREVCAFLNSSGGEVVIGIADDGSIVPVSDPSTEIGRLRDRLASLIAPSLQRVHLELLEGDGILVSVDPPRTGERELFAVRSSKGRIAVFRRIGARVVALDWAEVRETLSRGQTQPPDASKASAEGVLLRWREDLASPVLDRVGGLLLVFTVDPRIPDSAAKASSDRIRRAVEVPSDIGLRGEGVHYAVGKCRKKQYTLRSGSRDELYRALEFDLRGILRFATRLDILLGDRVPGCPRPKTIYPLSLIETIVSCSVLFGTLIESTGAEGTVACALDLVGIEGHSLPPFRQGTLGFQFESHWKDPHSGPALTEILKASLEAKTFAKNSHRLAHELVAWIYEEFGCDSSELGKDGEKVPYWDQAAGRFAFPA